MREAGLWDYVVVNDDLEETMKEMSAIAQRCLLGRVGNATDKPAPPTTAQKEVGQAAELHEVGSVKQWGMVLPDFLLDTCWGTRALHKESCWTPAQPKSPW